MPDRKYFASNEEYNAAMADYRRRNHDKIMEIKKRSDQKLGYAQQRRWQKDNPERERARWAVRRARARGEIIKQPCVVCGDENSVAHHPDYSKPLEIIWYCRSHHRAHHYGQKNATRKEWQNHGE